MALFSVNDFHAIEIYSYKPISVSFLFYFELFAADFNVLCQCFRSFFISLILQTIEPFTIL